MDGRANSILIRRVGGGIRWQHLRSWSGPRHPGDIVRVTLGISTLAIAAMVAYHSRPSALETGVFHFINHLPDALTLPLLTVMQAGALPTIAITVVMALLVRRPHLA
ncbi:MAG: hypothetical protein M3328_14905, partial [Chloroflexota bacterium]|nr:hypothetical protein [Chloroflexota bacterium]